MSQAGSASWERIEACLADVLEVPEPEQAAFLETRLAAETAEVSAEVRRLFAQSGSASRIFAESPVAQMKGLGAGSRLGPWELQHPLGQGGMGVVWKAKRVDGQAEMYAAIKLLPPAFRDELGPRFQIEKQILAQLQHPNIARLLDAGVEHGQAPNFVMEFVDGAPLAEFLRANPEAGPLKLFAKICDAIRYAHANLIVHRDLKPQNILVERATGEPKVLDFGIGKMLNESAAAASMTATMHRAFSLDYASPEQIRGGTQVNIATDIYSLGLILYEMTAGEPARRWNGKALGEVLDLSATFTPPANPKLGQDLVAVIAKAAAPDPDLRYRSVEELAADVERLRLGLPVEARPAAWWRHSWAFARRNRGAVASTAAALVTIVGLAFWGWISAARAERERAAAIEQARLLRESLQRENDALAKETASRNAAEEQGKQAREQEAAARKMEALARTREAESEERLQSLLRIYQTSLQSAAQDVANLQGGTRASITLMERALEQLSKITPPQARRAPFVAQQAETHSNLAELYGGQNDNLGDKDKRTMHLSEAERLWTEAHRSEPGNLSYERAALSARFTVFRAANSPMSPANAAAWMEFERAWQDFARRMPGNERQLGNYYFQRSIGRPPADRLADLRRSLEWFAKTLDERRPTMVALRDNAIAHKYLSGQGLPIEQNLHHAAEALRMDRMRAALNPNDASLKLDVAISLSAVADAKVRLKDFAGAAAGHVESYQIRKARAIGDPENVRTTAAIWYPLRVLLYLRRIQNDWAGVAQTVAEFEWVEKNLPHARRSAADTATLQFHRGLLAEHEGRRQEACGLMKHALEIAASQQRSSFQNEAEATCAATAAAPAPPDPR